MSPDASRILTHAIPASANRLLYLLYMAVVTTLLLSFGQPANDDPFITYRYAQNLAQGQGLVYNAGLRVLSTTSPSFPLILAAMDKLGMDPPFAATLIGAASIAAGALLLWHISRSLRAPAIVGLIALALYPLCPIVLRSLGSEVPLYLACCLAGFAAYLKGRYSTCIVCLSLATFVRPDGLIFAMVLIGYLVIKHVKDLRTQPPGIIIRRAPWPGILIAVGLGLAWVAFSTTYFGSPIPATLFAKHQQGAMLISRPFSLGAVLLAIQYSSYWYYWLAVPLAALGVLHVLRRTRAWIALIAWAAVHFVCYCALGVSAYPWYYASLAPGLIAALGMGAERFIQTLTGLLQRAKMHTLAVMAPACLLAVLTVGQLIHVAQLPPDTRFPIYRAIGEWLYTHTGSRTTVGALEVGIVGYYSQRAMVDFAGLIQPDVAAQLTPQSTYDDAAQWAMRRYRPDYLVLERDGLVTLQPDTPCIEAVTFAGRSYGHNRDFAIYQCRW